MHQYAALGNAWRSTYHMLHMLLQAAAPFASNECKVRFVAVGCKWLTCLLLSIYTSSMAHRHWTAPLCSTHADHFLCKP
jgi:hypothetical protein